MASKPTTTTVKDTGIKFEIKGKEHELQLTWPAVKRLHNMVEGGAFGLVGKSVMGDNETYSYVVFAGLLHTGEDYSLADVDEAIDEAFQKGKLGMSSVINTLHSFILENSYYKTVVDNMLEADPNAKAAVAKLRAL